MTKEIAYKIAQLFKPDGLFASKIENYEYREQQVEMLTAIYEAFTNEEVLLIEAGTGTGKSLAYLVPGIIWAKENNQRIIISTNTKNLQEQLFKKEIPFLNLNLPFHFTATILKGRTNYLCWQKLLYNNEKYKSIDSVHDKSWHNIFVWAQETLSGEREEFEQCFPERTFLWDSLSADSNNCYGRECRYFDECFVYMARNRAWDADIIVINHSLLLADIITANKILPPYEQLIIDEAHNILDEASQAFGFNYAVSHNAKLLDKIYKVGNSESKDQGFIVDFDRALRFAKHGFTTKRKALVKAKIQELKFSIDQINKDFKEQQILVHDWAISYTQKDFSTIQPNSIRLTEKHKETKHWEAIINSSNNIISELQTIRNCLQDIWIDLESMEVANGDNNLINYYLLIPNFIAEINKIIISLNEIFFSEKEDWAYWGERLQKKSSVDYLFRSIPLQINKILYDNIFSRLKSTIVTSATMTIDNTFIYIREALGLNHLPVEKIRELQLHSPFDYKEQAVLCLPNDFLLPDHRLFEKELSDFCIEISCTLRRKILFLFTSYMQLQSVYSKVKGFLESENIDLLAQGIDGTPSSIVEKFKASKLAVLFGTASLWEGVDLPGALLSCVVIVKIPFAVPTDPYEEAKAEFMQKNGLNYFYDFSLPRAIIKLKQGAGRLIRSSNDIGALVILDKRIILKGYGNEMISSLPSFTQYIGGKSDVIREIRNWFRNEEIIPMAK